MKINTKLKYIFYSLIPVLILFVMDWRDDFSGWKRANLLLRKDITIAEITDNPFYEVSKNVKFDDGYGGLDYEEFEDFVSSDEVLYKKQIKYKYSSNGRTFIDSLSFMYYPEYGDPETGSYYSEWENQLMEFMPSINSNPNGSTFKVYYYKDKSIPSRVVDEVQRTDGFIKIVLFNSFFILWIIAIIISSSLFYSYFKKD
ncbi:hypothetical protein [Sphingobacterium sp.]|uniref:hypothetical protein n=1 Tax=Sphingobacterium sp. TaxID=341027 RepID=UPI0028AB4176|nr:hypothetical protein [Sphingobacterium sp.]